MENSRQMTNEESLKIIQQMITQAKVDITDNGIGWLLWGSLIFLTCISTYVFIDIGSANIFLGWNIFGILTIVLLGIDLVRHRKKPVRTYVGDLLKLVDIGFIICLFTVIFSINVAVSPNSGFGFFLMIFAFLMLVKGGALKSRALIIGAAVNWAGALAIFVNKEFRYDMLIMAGAVLAGYIIPGMMLRNKYRKSNNFG